VDLQQYEEHIIPKLELVQESIEKLKTQILDDMWNDKLDGFDEYSLQCSKIEKFFENCLCDLAWCFSRIAKQPLVTEKGYKNSLHSKIRKAIGYRE